MQILWGEDIILNRYKRDNNHIVTLGKSVTQIFQHFLHKSELTCSCLGLCAFHFKRWGVSLLLPQMLECSDAQMFDLFKLLKVNLGHCIVSDVSFGSEQSQYTWSEVPGNSRDRKTYRCIQVSDYLLTLQFSWNNRFAHRLFKDYTLGNIC